RAHARIILGGCRFTPDGAIGELDRRAQPVHLERRSDLESVRPGNFVVFSRTVDEAGNALEGHLGGDFARLVTAHAVADDEKTVLDQNRVLVESALSSDVGKA